MKVICTKQEYPYILNSFRKDCPFSYCEHLNDMKWSCKDCLSKTTRIEWEITDNE